MKVKEIPYKRVTIEWFRQCAEKEIDAVKNATCVEQVLEARKRFLSAQIEWNTAEALSYSRYTLDSTDAFYLSEHEYYNQFSPVATQFVTDFGNLLLDSPFRAELEKRLSPVLFQVLEVNRKAMNPEIVSDLQEENALVTKYSDFMSQLLISFRGEEMPLSYLKKYMKDDDRQTRIDAYCALGRAMEQNADKFDDIYDRLVKVRDRMAKKMGYDNFVELGYARMGRICYNRDMIEQFRNNVLQSVVPVVTKMKRQIAKNLGIEQMLLCDNDVSVKGGDPKPIGGKEQIFNAAKKMYASMGKDAAEFFDFMLETDAFDVESRKGKWGGGYCTSFMKYRQPFILANFNGTSADVDVMTHEAGHAFADYMGYKNNPYFVELNVGGMETAETHSMSMEFFAWKYIDGFFGDDADKYRYMHLVDSFSFLPYGVIVDAFQQKVYENPDWTPKQRNDLWRKLEEEFRPWMSASGLPYLENGTRWQYQMHVYEMPFYYIDYCLAQIAALGFMLWAQDDYDAAFGAYVKLLSQGGQKTFVDLLAEAGIASPFDAAAVKNVSQRVGVLVEELLSKI